MKKPRLPTLRLSSLGREIRVRYSGIRLGTLETVDVAYTVQPKGLHVAIDRHVPAEYLTDGEFSVADALGLVGHASHSDGPIEVAGRIVVPVLLHFPDYGTLLVRSSKPESTWKFIGRRGPREVQLALQAGLPRHARGHDDPKGRPVSRASWTWR